MRVLRVVMPLVASVVLLVTLATCLALTLAQHRYVGGLRLPYFSDMGRDKPSYYVFSVGLTVVALAIWATWVLNFVYQLTSLRLRICRGLVGKSVLCWSVLVLVLGVLSTPALPTLSICSTSDCPDVHSYATFWFFVLETLAIVINTCVMYKLLRVVRRAPLVNGPDGVDLNQRTCDRLKATVALQTLCAVLLVLAALIFVPIGAALVGPTPRLPVRACMAKNLGVQYCSSKMRDDGTDVTKLWDYEKNWGLHQARAVCEWIAMLALVGYSLSFLLYQDHEADSARAAGRQDLEANLLPS